MTPSLSRKPGCPASSRRAVRVGLARLGCRARRGRTRRRATPRRAPPRARQLELPPRLERAPEEARGLDVRVLRLRALAGGQRVPPRVSLSPRVEEVQREQLGVSPASSPRLPLVHLADPRAARAGAGRTALVGRVPEERVAEAEAAGGEGSRSTNSLSRSHASASAARSCPRSTLGDEVGAEASRRAPTPSAAARDRRAGACRSASSRPPRRSRAAPRPPALRGRGDELLQEERVAARALGDRRDLVRRQPVWPRPRRRAPAPRRRRAARAGSSSPGSAAPLGGGEAALAGRRVTQSSHGLVETCAPRWRSRSAEASSIQCTSSKTSSVGAGSSFASSASTTPCRRARRNAGCELVDLRASAGPRRRAGSRASGSHGTRSGAIASTRSRSTSARRGRRSAGSSSSDRSSPRNAK